MGILTKALASLGVRKSGPWRISEIPGHLFAGGAPSAAGVRVSEEDALSLSAVFAACNLLSQVKASLPLHVYQQRGERKDKATGQPVYYLLHNEPNKEMSAFSFHAVREFHRLLWGRSYAEIQWAGNGQPVALWPLEPWRVQPRRDKDTDELYYLVDGTRRVAAADMLVNLLVSFDGVTGRSFVDFAVDSLGLGLAAQEFSARFFGNGAQHGGLLTHAGNPTQEQREAQRKAWIEHHQGPANAHKTGVLWGGWGWQPNTGAVDPDKAQLMDARRFTTEEVARWLNLPPHLLRDLTRATFSNIEHQGIDFVTYTLGPVLTNYEQEYDRKLLDPPGLYSKHNVRALLRGDDASRASYFHTLLGDGVFSINDVLALEDMNPVEGGDTRFVPVNMQPLEEAIKPKESPAQPPAAEQPGSESDPAAAAGTADVQATALNGAQIASLVLLADKLALDEYPPDATRAALQASFPSMDTTLIDKVVDSIEQFKKDKPPVQTPAPEEEEDAPDPDAGGLSARLDLLTHTLARLARVEANELRRAAGQPRKLLAWVDEFYPRLETMLTESLTPVLACIQLDTAADQVASSWCTASRDCVLTAADGPPGEFPARVEYLLSQWQTRPAQTAAQLLGVTGNENAD